MIICGDARVELSKLPYAALILTDPPYNIGFKYGQYKDNLPDTEYIARLALLKNHAETVAVIQYPEETMRYVVPALGVPDKVIAWCYNTNLRARAFRLISIYGRKPDFATVRQPYKNPGDRRVKKLIEAGSAGAPLYDWWADIQMVKNVSLEKSIHPCPIPEALVERLILVLTHKGETVLDPFCGSGTVPFVAQNLGRKGIGIEIDRAYAAHAAVRCGVL